MIIENKVIEISCMAYDFCKFFDAMMGKYKLKPIKKREYHRSSTLSKAEVMMIIILFHDYGYSCLKHFYLERVCKHMSHLFPQVVYYNRFAEIQREVAIPLDFVHQESTFGKMYRHKLCRQYSFACL